MAVLNELRDKLGAIAKRMHDINAKAKEESRGLTDQEWSDWKGLQADYERTEEQLKFEEKLQTRSDANEKTLQEEDRKRFEDRQKSFDANNDDPARPLTAYEQCLGFTTWATRLHNPSPRGVKCAERMGIRLGADSIELNMDRGFDENGISFRAPRSHVDVAKQSELRRQQRDHEVRLYRENRKAYDAMMEQRAQSLTTTAGGFTVPDEMMRPLEQSMLAWGGMRQVSTIITTSTGADLPIPTVNDTANKGEIIAENTAVNEQDMVFAQVVLQAFKYSSKMIKFSVELLQDSSVNFAGLLGEILGTRIGRITNDHFTTGTGTGQPRGVVVAAGNSSITSGTIGVLTYPELISIKHTVDPAYRTNARWMMPDAVLAIIKKTVDASTGRPVWAPSMAVGEPGTIDGDPFTVNQSMASGASAKHLLYGDFSKYFIRDSRGITLLRLDERYAELHQVAFLAFMRTDGDLIDAGTDPVKYATEHA